MNFDLYSSLLEDHQILCAVDDVHGNVLQLTPPLCFTVENARDLVSALDAVLLPMTQSVTD